MACKKITKNTQACVLKSGRKYRAVLRRKVRGGTNILESHGGLSKKKADAMVNRWSVELREELGRRKRRYTPYP